jgi:hypothetical protein
MVIRQTRDAVEPDHAALWVTPADAIARLHPDSHRWAVVEWLADHAIAVGS